MKTSIIAILFLSSIVASAAMRPQIERLMAAYETHGDTLYFTLYWHPDSRDIFRECIPASNEWVGFERSLWKKVPEDKKLALLNELGANLDELEDKELESWWARHDTWRHIHSQVTLLAMFLDQDGDFIELAFADRTLRPGFQWILDKRPPDFDARHIGSTLATGETVSVFPQLVEHLLDTSERQRLECFSRILELIAKTKSNKPAEQSVPPKSDRAGG